jgi:uridylate kinase
MTSKKVFVASIGGSLVATPSPNIDYVQKLAKMLISLKSEGIICHVVIGGGKIARDYITAQRACAAGINPDLTNEECDELGILATRMNASLLLAALGKHAYPGIPTQTTPNSVKSGLITVMGGVVPGQTTDAVSAQLARAIGCKNVINATNVPGVYEKDPRKYPDLPMISEITHDKLIEIVGTVHAPGNSTVIDPVCAKIFKEENITGYVIDGSNLENLQNLLEGKPFVGTTIIK